MMNYDAILTIMIFLNFIFTNVKMTVVSENWTEIHENFQQTCILCLLIFVCLLDKSTMIRVSPRLANGPKVVTGQFHAENVCQTMLTCTFDFMCIDYRLILE